MKAVNKFHRFIVESAGHRIRIDQELLWRALRAVHPELAVTTVARAKLRDLLDQLVLNGLAEMPKGRDGWDQSSLPVLPNWIRLPRQAPQSDETDLKSIPWAPELRFLSSARTDIPASDLLKLQRFFAEGGRDLPIVPIKERSLQIFGDEKRLDALYPGSAIFAVGRLTLDQVRCSTCPEPLGWRRGPSPDGPFIVLENAATWHSYCRWNDLVQYFSAVIYGGGNRFVDSVVFLEEICREIGGLRRILYFGDLDMAGLSIPQRATNNAIKLALPKIEPHFTSYRWLIQLDRREAGSVDEDVVAERELCDWLGDLADAAWSFLSVGKRIAQEHIGWQFLQEKRSAE